MINYSSPLPDSIVTLQRTNTGLVRLFLTSGIKRATDICIASAGLILSAPLLLFYSVIATIITRRSPFQVQSRAISTAHPAIRVLKLRTLKPIIYICYSKTDSATKESQIEAAYIPFGRILRTLGFDKLPQLINVLKGEMSLIGPKALKIENILKIESTDASPMKLRTIIKSKPGISGLWHTNRITHFSLEELTYFDSLYEREKGFITDMKILINEFENILFRKNIHTPKK